MIKDVAYKGYLVDDLRAKLSAREKRMREVAARLDFLATFCAEHGIGYSLSGKLHTERAKLLEGLGE